MSEQRFEGETAVFCLRLRKKPDLRGFINAQLLRLDLSYSDSVTLDKFQ